MRGGMIVGMRPEKLDYARPVQPEPVQRIWRVLAGIVFWVRMLLIVAAHFLVSFTRFCEVRPS